MAIGEGRDPATTAARLSDWLRTRMPPGSGPRVSSIVAPGMGFSNETLLVDVESGRSAAPVVHRLVARFRPRRQIFPAYDLAEQYRVLQGLAGTPVPVPKTLWFEPDPEWLGVEFYVTERVDGIVPADHPTYHAAGPLTEMSPDRRQVLWWDGVENLARVHLVDWRAAGLDFLVRPTTGGDPLDQQLAYYESFLASALDGGEHVVCSAALAWLRANRPSRSAPESLCWGDARIGNMIFHEERCRAVLDWEMAFLGEAEADLAWWLFLDWHHSEGYGISRLEGLPGPEETVARWENLVGRAARRLEFYEAFAAFRFAVIMIRVATLARDAGLPVPDDLATNNPCTRRLRQILDA